MKLRQIVLIAFTYIGAIGAPIIGSPIFAAEVSVDYTYTGNHRTDFSSLIPDCSTIHLGTFKVLEYVIRVSWITQHIFLSGRINSKQSRVSAGYRSNAIFLGKLKKI